MKNSRRVLAFFLITLMLVAAICPHICFATVDNSKAATILFTHDLHSHFLPTDYASGKQEGGYAYLMSAINEQKQKHPNALLLDAGDFSMGSLFQTAFSASALELKLMGAMGVDVTTFGNHEFDYLPSGLVSMLNSAVKSGVKTPYIVNSNYRPPVNPDESYKFNAKEVRTAFDNYGVKDYIILERGGVYFAIFGLIGKDADECAPNSGMVFLSPIQEAKRVVDEATKECLEKYNEEPIIIALSHSGTEALQGEDYELAKEVSEIDLIISGHTHTLLEKPIQVEDTYIVSAGEYGKHLGAIDLKCENGKATLLSYELIPINDSLKEDCKIASLIESYKSDVESNYLSEYGMTFDQVLTNNNVSFESVDDVYATLHESTLGNLFSDAYMWAASESTGKRVDIALTAAGVIRESIPLGDVTVSDVFNSASLGVGTEGELVGVYITGKDLKSALEVDCSLSAIMPSAQLFMSGIEYRANTNRMIFNKVSSAHIRRADGTLEEIEDHKLYYTVCGMYMGQMLSTVQEKSFSLLSITPRDASGNPIANDKLSDYIIKTRTGSNLKEWYAISSYLFFLNDGIEKYSSTDGRKEIISSFNPKDLFENANVFTYVMLAVIVVLVLCIFLIARAIIRRIRRKK